MTVSFEADHVLDENIAGAVDGNASQVQIMSENSLGVLAGSIVDQMPVERISSQSTSLSKMRDLDSLDMSGGIFVDKSVSSKLHVLIEACIHWLLCGIVHGTVDHVSSDGDIARQHGNCIRSVSNQCDDYFLLVHRRGSHCRSCSVPNACIEEVHRRRRFGLRLW